MAKRALINLMCICCLLGAAWIAKAQTPTTGQIAGQVVDPTGAVVPGTRLAATSAAGTQRETTSDASGHYRFPLLVPGVYSLEVEVSGFKPFTVKEVVVKITETTTLDVQLTVAARTEKVEVTAEPPLVRETPTRGEVIQQTAIRQLPLPTRNFQQLLTLTPGTSGYLPNSSELGRGDAVFSVNGQRTISNSVIINNTDANAIGSGSTPNLAVPSSDSLQEFIVQTSMYDASQGRGTGGIVAVVTKSGGNQYHGNMYEFLRNDVLNANEYFLKRQGAAKPRYNRNQFGGTFGGPIAKDKLWFFASYEGTREKNGTSRLNSLATVFVPGNLTNDRSAAALAALSKSYAPLVLAAYKPYFTFGLIDPTAAALLQAKLPNGQYLIPSAPSPTALPTPVSLTIPTISTHNENQFNANVDYQVSARNRLSVKFFFGNTDQNQGKFQSFGAGNPLQLPGFGSLATWKQRVLAASDTHLFSSTLVNDFRFGYSTISTVSTPVEPFTAAQFGISSPLGALFPQMPTISISNMMDIGPSAFQDNDALNRTYGFADTLSWTRGRHTLKIGGEYKRQQCDLRFDLYTRGQIFALGFSGNAFADLMMGLSGLSIMGSGVNNRQNRANDYNFFFQDDWRVTDRLTLNYGLRYEYFGPFYETHGRYVGIDRSKITTTPITGGVAVTGGYVQASNATSPLPGVPTVGESLVKPDRNNLGPRFGFAFQPFAHNNRIILRGGYGIYYDRPNARLLNNQVLSFPYYMLAEVYGTPLKNPFVQVPQPSAFPLAFNNKTIFPFGGPPALLPAAVTGGLTFVPATGLFPDISRFSTPYVQQYNFGLQYEFIRNWLLDVSYIGSGGRKLTRLRGLNQGALAGAVYPLVPQALQGPLAPGLSDSPIQAFGVQLMESSASSSYNSLQAQLTKRFSHGLQFLLAYTYAHSIDDYSGDASGTSDNSVVPGNEITLNNRATSDFDRRHRLVFSYIYDLPAFYRGDSKAAKLMLNNWEIAGILTLQTGAPFTVLTNVSAVIAARADWKSGCTVSSASGSGAVTDRLNKYFDTSCFASASGLGNFGTTGRNILRGPDQRNLDFSIVKFFPVTETSKLEFRTEFFNLTNTPSFANPVSIAQSANFGQIVSTSTGSRSIQFALKFNF